jgi:hypothetical protein
LSDEPATVSLQSSNDACIAGARIADAGDTATHAKTALTKTAFA